MKSVCRILGSVLAVLPAIAAAHHSTAEYDGAVVNEISGTLTGVQWRNPHVLLTVRVEVPGGETEDWQLESSAVYILERMGLSRDTFMPGMNVRVAGNPSRRRHAMQPTNILLPGGEEARFLNAPARWTENAIGGAMRNDIVDRSELGLFRVWSLDSSLMANYGRSARAIANARFLDSDNQEALDAAYARDPCEPQGMPGVMLNPLPISFAEQENRIELMLTPFNGVRYIHMQEPESAELPDASIFGLSRGRWVDGALEIVTTDVAWPYFDDAGRPLSNSAEITERYAISEDGNRLTYTQTINDPAMLAEAVTVSWDYIDIGEEVIEPLFCEQP